MRRGSLAVLCCAVFLAAGCIEGEQTYTINPNGSGKVRINVIMNPPIGLDGGPKKGDFTLDDLLSKYVSRLLSNKDGSDMIDAWADVSASFTPDGKLQFTGTAYFKDVNTFSASHPFFASGVTLTRNAEGAMTLVPSRGKKKDKENPNQLELGGGFPRKTPAEIARMTDAQLDEYILMEKVNYQSSKPLMRALFSDAKMKTTITLPGEISNLRGYSAVGKTGLTNTINGNELIATADKIFTQDAATLRKLYRNPNGFENELDQLAYSLGVGTDATATVAKPGKPLFDYDAEVKAAREAYPKLREKFKLPNEVRLPGEASKGPK